MILRLLLAAGLMVGVATPALAYGPMNCRDPWIAQAIYQVYHRMPVANSPTTEECDITHYNNGHWNTYGDLVAYVTRSVGATSNYANPQPVAAPPAFLSLQPNAWKAIPATTFNTLPQANSGPYRMVLWNGYWSVIGASSNLIHQDGAGIVGPGSGSSLIASGAGNLIASGGGNLIASGGGNIQIQSYLIASGAGNIVPLPSANAGQVMANPRIQPGTNPYTSP